MKFRALAVAALALPGLALTMAAPASAATVHPKVSVSANHHSIHLGSRVTLTGHVGPNEHGHRVGLQRYYSHKWHTQKTVKLSKSSHYALTIKPSRTGTYVYRVHDPKAKGWAAASSKTVTVKVTHTPSSGGGGSATPPAASCYPLTNGGNCYEPGEFCRASDHGASGVAGDGEAITCEDNNGWRWEPS